MVGSGPIEVGADKAPGATEVGDDVAPIRVGAELDLSESSLTEEELESGYDACSTILQGI